MVRHLPDCADPVAVAVLIGIVFLDHQTRVRSAGWSWDDRLSESIVIGLFITTLMVTFLLTWHLDETSTVGTINCGCMSRSSSRFWR
jgi:hypothetical protein